MKDIPVEISKNEIVLKSIAFLSRYVHVPFGSVAKYYSLIVKKKDSSYKSNMDSITPQTLLFNLSLL